MKIKFLKKDPQVIIPTRGHYNDAGLDCYALEDFKIRPNNGMIKVSLGFGLEVPDGYMAVLKPRSSMNAKGIITQVGTIDSGYRGEISAIFINANPFPVEFKKGDKICQLVIEPVILADLVEDLVNDRGNGGFGSTGR